ncbi:hypothetical protein V6615_11885 [Oscillospiraceae bacterium PP1C4]
MIKIRIEDNLQETIKTEHYIDIKKRAKDTIEKVKGIAKYKKLCEYIFDVSGNIDDDKLEKLITGNKNELIKIIDVIGKITLDKNDPFDKLYNNFTKRDWSKSLLEKLGVKVCPYCNRQYTFTLRNDGIRPQFDHYFPKSLFAYLSVSLFNLVPSCSICNSKKHALNTYEAINDLYYPYEDEFGNDVVFQTYSDGHDFSYWTGNSDNFDLKLVVKDNIHSNKIENLNKYLKIELLYKQHKDYVKDIIRNAVIYNDSRINELLEQFPSLFYSKNEILNSIFMSYIDKEGWGKRPLSKLTHDIYEEFKIFSSIE